MKGRADSSRNYGRSEHFKHCVDTDESTDENDNIFSAHKLLHIFCAAKKCNQRRHEESGIEKRREESCYQTTYVAVGEL